MAAEANIVVRQTLFRASEFKSAYGPKYVFQPHYYGLSSTNLLRLGLKSAGFAGALGAGALYFASGIPRIQQDILMKIPFLAGYYVKEVHPADNVSWPFPLHTTSEGKDLNALDSIARRSSFETSSPPGIFAHPATNLPPAKMDKSPIESPSRPTPIALPLAILAFIWAFSSRSGFVARWVVPFPCLLAIAASYWRSVVSELVPEPYLDEFFHIPQAQKYCQGSFEEWDDKITTPPGLYILSIILPGIVRKGQDGSIGCDVGSLRAVNVAGLLLLTYLVLLCRQQIEARLHDRVPPGQAPIRSQYAAHTALNIALFPLLFFFSGLYYTDVLSTVAVVAAFLNHLSRLGHETTDLASDLTTILLGLVSLLMRQTNVFWTVVFLGGLEAVHAVKSLKPQPTERPVLKSPWEQLKFSAWRYSLGEVHDPPLNMVWPDDMILAAISLIIAGVCNLGRVLRQIWPYLAVLMAFISFVAWNGSVVLGDKSNHVATIHLAQMLYVWPFFAFFSLPLIAPCIIPITAVFLQSLEVGSGPTKRPTADPSPSSRDTNPTKNDSASNKSTPRLLTAVDFVLKSKMIIWPAYLVLTVVLSLAIVKYNTIIHPFTLADNRHYMFYVFRYTIRRGGLIRFLLVLPYTISRWMVWAALAGSLPTSAATNPVVPRAVSVSRFINYPVWMPSDIDARQTTLSVPDKDASSQTQETSEQAIGRTMANDPLAYSEEPVPTSTALIFLLATTLSLITAPLVEPRYFIIPWVIWRLLLPAWRLPLPGREAGSQQGGLMKHIKNYDLRLVAETAWFILINVVTGYIFLCWPYVWRAEDGSILDDGRHQRFMW
ncbi:hypothetical protein S7711_05522 [Stachybotrys chartarum IBT 7711]|uniref:Dol-P-Glc:Glc(2)Man(9)GlcNAc(2)-PP-Dol alpha-1,2-glucosyltransferase n=1 Tax=Stachybotrys chartarum (strain CBS 109288 / IBT 7711) TaxID=1280523 RepID=A0A084AS34_STACB|nr:hypothetical protein S7711_05522 [Stachybotrys chartarum IBT 7711]